MSPHLWIDCSHRRLVKRLIKTVDSHYTQDSMSLYIIRRRKLSNNASTPSSEWEGVYVGRGVACHVPQWRDSPREVDSPPAVDLHISFAYLSSFAVQRCRQPGWTLHFTAEQCRTVVSWTSVNCFRRSFASFSSQKVTHRAGLFRPL